MPQLRQSYVSVDLQKMLTWLKVKINTVFIRLTAWALIKFLDLESGRLFEAGRFLHFLPFKQV